MSCDFQRTAVNRHPALWSPDLPPVRPATRAVRTSGCLACFGRHCSPIRHTPGAVRHL